jgi:hypothetical protein
MSLRELVRQLNAVKSARPIHRYSTLHMRIDSNPMLVAFVRMAGESRPWAIAYGRLKDETPIVLSVPDGRNRIAVSEMCEEFAEDFLEYFRVSGYTWSPITKENLGTGEIPQIWVPSSRHVEMFHHLQYAYWRVRKGDDRTQPLTVFARLSGWIFRESTRLGQQSIVDAAQLFRNSFVFPADSTSLGHLGTCIEWFDEHEDLRSARFAVREATLLRDSPTLDPEIDSKILSPLLLSRAKLVSEDKDTKTVDKKIAAHLAPEVTRRWELMRSAHQIFSSDVREINPGVEDLTRATMESFYSQFQRIEENMQDPDLGPAYTQHPETDFHGSAAASNYFVMTAADTAYLAKLVHADEELQAEAIASGKAFFAEVIKVENLGSGRTTTPIWTMRIQIAERLRIREGERYSPLMAPGHGIQVRSLEIIDSENLEVVAEWVDRKTVPLDYPINSKPVEIDWVGHRVMFVPKDGSEFDKSKSRAVWNAANGPGSWLTHGSAPIRVEASVVDDITQLAGEN